jgi:hypothetical protein
MEVGSSLFVSLDSPWAWRAALFCGENLAIITDVSVC